MSLFIQYDDILHTPLDVLFYFASVYQNLNWDDNIVTVFGFFPKNSIYKYLSDGKRMEEAAFDLIKEPTANQQKYINFIMYFREKCNPSNNQYFKAANYSKFIFRYLNIMDPLATNNNVGRSINLSGAHRITSNIILLFHKLNDIYKSPKSDPILIGYMIANLFCKSLLRISQIINK